VDTAKEVERDCNNCQNHRQARPHYPAHNGVDAMRIVNCELCLLTPTLDYWKPDA